VQAFTVWPFKEKRFKFEGLIDAGSLGLEDLAGSIIGFGDWNGDQSWVYRYTMAFYLVELTC
jgi:hypothetical protein